MKPEILGVSEQKDKTSGCKYLYSRDVFTLLKVSLYNSGINMKIRQFKCPPDLDSTRTLPNV